MRRPSWFCSVGVLVLALALSRPAAAQTPAPGPAATSPAPTVSYAPTLAATRLGFSADEQAPLAVNASAARMGRREGRALALVGGAAVIAGILIGDDAGTVIAIGGAGIGLYGLYIWQR
ncbi:MAG TPA: hypothetical protein VI297_05110 [Gemmatimonadales bacterium]